MQTGKEPRPEKKAITGELKSVIENAVFVILTDYRGMKVSHAAELRQELHPLDAEFHVVKNRFFEKAVEGTESEGLKKGLSGATAMISGGGDVVTVAKILKKFNKEKDLPAVKLGTLRGVILSAEDVETLATLPSREELQAKVVGTLAAPMSQTVGVLNQKLSSLLYVLQAVQEKKQAA